MKKVVSILIAMAPLMAFAQSPAKIAAQKLGYMIGFSFTLVLPMIAVGLFVYGVNRAIRRRRAFNLQK